MAITGRTQNECFNEFRKHVAQLVDQIVPTDCPMLVEGYGEKRTLSFKSHGSDDAVPIRTPSHGTIYLYMAQELVAVWEKEPKHYRLRTIAYWYKIFTQNPLIDDEALVRWEYESKPKIYAKECPRHMQFGKNIQGRMQPVNGGTMDLNRFHFPTGWVLMEQVLRFLIHEFGMQPPCGSDEWPKVLHKYENLFFTSFTDKGGQGIAP